MTSGADTNPMIPGRAIELHYDRIDKRKHDMLLSLTTQELLQELCKRKGVDRYNVGRCEPKTVYGEAIILVVRQS